MNGVGPIFAIAMLAGSPELPTDARSQTESKPKRPVTAIAPAVNMAAKWGIVTSVKRSPERNRAVGGAPNSFHLSGRAIDIARRPGVRHADLEAAYRKAGFILIESLDEGDHSHFAFGTIGQATKPQVTKAQEFASNDALPQAKCLSDIAPAGLLKGRRRPDRFDGCAQEPEAGPRLKPLEAAD